MFDMAYLAKFIVKGGYIYIAVGDQIIKRGLGSH